jgi:hypothetical protein
VPDQEEPHFIFGAAETDADPTTSDGFALYDRIRDALEEPLISEQPSLPKDDPVAARLSLQRAMPSMLERLDITSGMTPGDPRVVDLVKAAVSRGIRSEAELLDWVVDMRQQVVRLGIPMGLDGILTYLRQIEGLKRSGFEFKPYSHAAREIPSY